MVIQYGRVYWDFDSRIRFQFSNFRLALHRPMLYWFAWCYAYSYVDMLYIMPYIIYIIHFVQHFLCDILQLFHTFHSEYCHTLHIFPSNLCNLYIFSRQFHAEWYTKIWCAFSIFDALNYILLHQHFTPYHILFHLYFIYF